MLNYIQESTDTFYPIGIDFNCDHIYSCITSSLSQKKNTITLFGRELAFQTSLEDFSSKFPLCSEETNDALISQEMQSGKYKINWDASNYTSSVYFYKILKLEMFLETKK